MSTLTIEKVDATATDIKVTEDELIVYLADGRMVSVPVEWFPRLSNASMEQRNNWRLIGDGIGIHWPDIDEDISVEGLLKYN